MGERVDWGFLQDREALDSLFEQAGRPLYFVHALNSYCHSLARGLSSSLTQHPELRGTLLALWPTLQISLAIVTSKVFAERDACVGSNYVGLRFSRGVLQIVVPADYWYTQPSDLCDVDLMELGQVSRPWVEGAEEEEILAQPVLSERELMYLAKERERHERRKQGYDSGSDDEYN
eukprot:TRINITY_DN12200_c0_g1_i1.p1 TRINITY_DN12200_c0_g1~~TRINITY_DN12200_c0_g1_i1.p1  ORF type:complete len:184 (-),score=55.16 TRINITY_DN12200_c0_g1_i1:62-589(-)